jgi:RNA-binding protein YhbY
MRTAIIYHSETGNTRTVAEYLARQTGADMVPVESKFPYNPLTRVVVGVRRAVCGTKDPVVPKKIDVDSYDCVVIGSPVWAGNPTPVINGAVANLEHCEGKEAVVYMTCSMAPRNAANILSRLVSARQMRVKGRMVILARDVSDYRTLGRLVTIVSTPDYGDISVE